MRSALDKVHWTHLNQTSRVIPDESISAGFWGIEALPQQTENFCHLKQVHSSNIFMSEDLQTLPRETEGDGIGTRQLQTTVAVQTADCLPVLFAASGYQTVMAVHAGWRGLSAGIVAGALQKFQDLNIPLHQVKVALGPCISGASFEVGDEVIAAFESAEFRPAKDIFYLCVQKGKDDRWHFDLPIYAVLQMLALGLPAEAIQVFQHCTFRESSKWFSYRRQHKTGRNWSWIRLKDKNAN